MGISVEYVAKETASNLWRNRVMTLAAILTVAVSLSLVGTSLLLHQAVNRQVNYLSGNVSLQIFMDANASKDEIHNVSTTLAQLSAQVKSVNYLDNQQSFNKMKQLFANNQAIIDAMTPAITPSVFDVQLVNPNDAETIASTFYQGPSGSGAAGATGSPGAATAGIAKVPGVYNVEFPAQSIKTLEQVTNVVQAILYVLAVLLVISSLVLILNAIRMAIFARRQEVGVMKLVGATNWFIRVPFMLEGLVQGLAGAAVAVLVVILSNIGIHSLVTHYSLQVFSSLSLPSGELVTTEILVVLMGVVVGAAGSSLAVRRFLDV